MLITPKMGLTSWNSLSDTFDHSVLESNNAILDQHDHSNGKGVQIGTAGIANGAITTSKMAAGAVTLAQMAPGAGRLKAINANTSVTAQLGQLLVCNTGVTVTLPNPATEGQIGVVAAAGSSSSPVIVANSTGIYGVGLAAPATSLSLGNLGAAVILQADGGAWYVIGGQQDTGWVPLSGLSQNISLSAAVATLVPAIRWRGDTVRLKGTVNVTGTIPIGTALWRFSASYRPSAQVASGFVYTHSGVGTATSLEVTTAGDVFVGLNIVAGDQLFLDGLTYTLV